MGPTESIGGLTDAILYLHYDPVDSPRVESNASLAPAIAGLVGVAESSAIILLIIGSHLMHDMVLGASHRRTARERETISLWPHSNPDLSGRRHCVRMLYNSPFPSRRRIHVPSRLQLVFSARGAAPAKGRSRLSLSRVYRALRGRRRDKARRIGIAARTTRTVAKTLRVLELRLGADRDAGEREFDPNASRRARTV